MMVPVTNREVLVYGNNEMIVESGGCATDPCPKKVV